MRLWRLGLMNLIIMDEQVRVCDQHLITQRANMFPWQMKLVSTIIIPLLSNRAGIGLPAWSMLEGRSAICTHPPTGINIR